MEMDYIGYLKNCQAIKEYDGVYYGQDVDNPSNLLEESNKDTKRVVTYVVKE